MMLIKKLNPIRFGMQFGDNRFNTDGTDISKKEVSDTIGYYRILFLHILYTRLCVFVHLMYVSITSLHKFFLQMNYIEKKSISTVRKL